MTVYYKINQKKEDYKNIYEIEYEDSMPHFLGYLNNNKIRKTFFHESRLFERIQCDEMAVKNYIKENMILKSVYHMGCFIYVLFDGNLVHVFSEQPFLTESEKMDRTFKISLIKTRYSQLLNDLFTDCNQERSVFYSFLNDGQIFFNDPNYINDIEGQEKYKFYHSMLLSHMSRNKMNHNSLLYFPKLEKLIKSKDFEDLKLELKNSKATIYDLIYSKSHSGLAQFVNNYL